jgi:putative membrane protein
MMSSDIPEENFGEQDELVTSDLAEEVNSLTPQASQLDSISSDAIPSDPTPVAEYSYLHPLSIGFALMAQVRQNIIPAGFALFGAAKGNLTFVYIAILIFIPTVAFAVVRYFTLRYIISDGELTVEEGLIFRRVRKVPTERIQNIDLVQNIVHRIFKVAEVRVETASGTEPEATLRVLSLTQVDLLRQRVATSRGMSESHEVAAANEDGVAADQFPYGQLNVDGTVVAKGMSGASSAAQTAATPVKSLLRIPLGWLVKAGLASDRGFVLVCVLLGAAFQYGDDEYSFIADNFKKYLEFLPQDSAFMYWGSIVLGSLVALLLLRILGVAWFILRFFGYQLNQVGDDLKISCGLFTKVSATVPVKRIQFISIHRPIILSWLGMASIRIETAGGGKSEDATASVSKRWFIPVIAESRVAEIIKVLRPELDWNESEFDWKPLAVRAGSRFARLGVIVSLLVIVVGLLATRPWGWVPGVVLMPLLVLYSVKKGKAVRYTRLANGVVYRSGIFHKKTSVTFFERVQTASFSQSPFDKRWGMATLAIDTAAAGPADHRIRVKFLDEKFARSEFEKIVALASHG